MGSLAQRKIRFGDAAAKGLTAFSAFLIIAIIIVVMVSIVMGGAERFTWEFLTEDPQDGMMEGGIYPAVIGTVIMTLIMSIMAVPLGTITALYLTEYAKETSMIARIIRLLL